MFETFIVIVNFNKYIVTYETVCAWVNYHLNFKMQAGTGK